MGLRGVDFGEEETSLLEEGPTRREGGREGREGGENESQVVAR